MFIAVLRRSSNYFGCGIIVKPSPKQIFVAAFPPNLKQTGRVDCCELPWTVFPLEQLLFSGEEPHSLVCEVQVSGFNFPKPVCGHGWRDDELTGFFVQMIEQRAWEFVHRRREFSYFSTCDEVCCEVVSGWSTKIQATIRYLDTTGARDIAFEYVCLFCT